MSESNVTLPSFWEVQAIRKIAEVNPRRVSSLNYPDERPTTFVPMQAIDDASGEILWAETKPFSEICKGYTYFEDGDVLFAKITPCMQNGKHAIAKNLQGGFGFGTTELHVIRPSKKVLAEWLHLFLRQPLILAKAELVFTGSAGQQRVPKEFIENLEIPVPPPAEQKRIIAILTQKLAAIDKARAAAQAQLAAAQALPAAYLRQAFTAQDGWQTTPIDSIAQIQSGYAFKSQWFTKSGIRLLRNANIFQGYVAWDDVVHLPVDKRSKFKEFELEVGDIVMALDRPVVSNGIKVARITPSDCPSLLLQRVGRFRFISDRVLPEYLYMFLQSPEFVKSIQEHDYSLGVPHVSPGQIQNIVISHPSINEQREIVATFAEKTRCVAKIQAEAQKQLNTIHTLPTAFLRQAFNGEL